jgi:pimeloyl-ACP methyl ester carboxylesterase
MLLPRSPFRTTKAGAEIREACDKLDVVELLPQINVPTLILHARHDSVAPFEQGRLIASSIPKARFVSLDGNNHLPLPGEPAWERMVAEIDLFLAD